MVIDWSKVLPVLISIAVIVFVSVISERSLQIAAISATMPLTAPLSLWIIYANSSGDVQTLRDYNDGMVIGFLATGVFIVVVWLANRAGWGLVPTIAGGYIAWAALLLVVRLFETPKI